MIIWRNAGDSLRTRYKPRVLTKHVHQVPCLKFELLLIAVTLAIAYLMFYLHKRIIKTRSIKSVFSVPM